MLLWGAAAGVAASVLNVLGRGSKAARAIADVLIASAFGAAYFFGLYFAASGEFRAYSLAAFALGGGVSLSLCARVYPFVRRAARRVISPLISLEKRLENRVEKRLSPYREKYRAKKAAAKEKREKRREKRRLAEEVKRRSRMRRSEDRARSKAFSKGEEASARRGAGEGEISPYFDRRKGRRGK